ncbi:hypothetical protein CERSUDRAFT_101244 [Gelatoporia subvermispora B]|uniref:Uncharacterized protein n=1 Tax=Ceriporiopsis subvermispora (strain B) TaxID=914234 RepID=M2QX84_CERS8|nr:hypothetical protein CERSUDRAFT_101244 [Gelatoporia subvermispora B]
MASAHDELLPGLLARCPAGSLDVRQQHILDGSPPLQLWHSPGGPRQHSTSAVSAVGGTTARSRDHHARGSRSAQCSVGSFARAPGGFSGPCCLRDKISTFGGLALYMSAVHTWWLNIQAVALLRRSLSTFHLRGFCSWWDDGTLTRPSRLRFAESRSARCSVGLGRARTQRALGVPSYPATEMRAHHKADFAPQARSRRWRALEPK